MRAHPWPASAPVRSPGRRAGRRRRQARRNRLHAGHASAVTVRVYALGETLASGKASLDRPLAEKQVVPGSAYAFDLAGAALPVTVEVSAPGHVPQPSTSSSPPSRRCRRRGSSAAGSAPCASPPRASPPAKAVVWGSLATAAPADQAGTVGSARTGIQADAAGTSGSSPATATRLAVAGRRRRRTLGRRPPAQSSPSASRTSRWTPGGSGSAWWTMRAKPVAGIRVAGEAAPAGAAAVTGDDGRAEVMVQGTRHLGRSSPWMPPVSAAPSARDPSPPAVW